MRVVYTSEICDYCRRLKADIQQIEGLTAYARFSNIKVHRKFYKMKRAADEFVEALRRM